MNLRSMIFAGITAATPFSAAAQENSGIPYISPREPEIIMCDMAELLTDSQDMYAKFEGEEFKVFNTSFDLGEEGIASDMFIEMLYTYEEAAKADPPKANRETQIYKKLIPLATELDIALSSVEMPIQGQRIDPSCDEPLISSNGTPLGIIPSRRI